MMIVGTAGHIDHGKTALVRALTGVDTDRLKEEKARGISIDLGFAYLPAPEGAALGFVDVPGHERFIHNMLAGATGIDFALLVVAVNDGIMPQTLEHLAIIDLLGIERGLVALTKTDLVASSRRAEVTDQIAATLSVTRLAGAEVIAVSTITGDGIEALRQRLFEAARVGTDRAPGRFRLAVDRCFTLAGAGTIVTGTVLSGTVSTGDRVMISPAGLMARVRSIHAQNRPAERGAAGERCALNLTGDGINKQAVGRGDILLDPTLHAPTNRIDATLRLLASEPKPIAPWTPVRLHHAAAEVGARIVLLADDSVAPGAERRVQLVLERPIAAAAGDRFVLRDTSAQRTVGGGRFLDLRAPTRKRRTALRHAQLDALALHDAESALVALLDCAPYCVDLWAFARDRALATSALEAIVERGNIVRVGTPPQALSPKNWTRFKFNLAAALEAFHAANPDLPGVGRERLRVELEPRLPPPAFAAALQDLARDGELTLHGAWVRLPGHEVRLTPHDAIWWGTTQPLLGGSRRFRPPRVRDIADSLAVPETDVRRLLKLVARMGEVDEVAHDHFFLRATVAEMVGIAVDLAGRAANGQFTAAEFRDHLDNGRKVAIQILEFFDRHGVTLRRGDLRRVNKHRLDLFLGPSGRECGGAGAHSGKEAFPVRPPDFKNVLGRAGR
jgi:selenocysteine-specific elongation factor